jgi:hypothetical protein
MSWFLNRCKLAQYALFPARILSHTVNNQVLMSMYDQHLKSSSKLHGPEFFLINLTVVQPVITLQNLIVNKQ